MKMASGCLRILPLPGSEAKNSNLMMFYEGKKSMSIDRLSSVEPDDHYPLTRTHENGVWMLENFAFAWKRSEELESYDVL